MISSCETTNSNHSNSTRNIPNAYLKYCSSCHGEIGNSMLGGAKDLTKSIFSNSEILEIIENGKSNMPAFKNILTVNQSNEIITYVNSLQND